MRPSHQAVYDYGGASRLPQDIPACQFAFSREESRHQGVQQGKRRAYERRREQYSGKQDTQTAQDGGVFASEQECDSRQKPNDADD